MLMHHMMNAYVGRSCGARVHPNAMPLPAENITMCGMHFSTLQRLVCFTASLFGTERS